MYRIPKTNRELAILIDTYDKNYFDGGIKEFLDGKRLVLDPILSDRLSGLKSVVGYNPELPGYYIDISSQIEMKEFMVALQYSLVKLLMIILGYYSKSPQSIYGDGGKLMVCVYKKFYGLIDSYDPYIVWGDVLTPEERSVEKQLPPIKGYSYWENSCYIDSLLITILINVSRFWRWAILFSNPTIHSKGFENCPKERINLLTEEVQQDLTNSFVSFVVHKSESKKCTRVRELMSECLNLKEAGRWVTYNVADLYSTLGALFPLLNLDIPYRTYRNVPDKGLVRGWLRYSKEPMLTMWDFMDPHQTEDTHKRIEWNMFRSPVLVFTNGGTPRIKHFGSTDPERVKIAHSSTKRLIEKRDAFGDTIINGRYQIIGVILLLGVSQDQEGGAHYVSYFKSTDESWYYYDDLRENILQISAPPDNIWNEVGGSMPAMYFYQLKR